jgi:DNA polymerase I-like protein with 3'-5' exonuclease and polymerase domains
MIEFNSDSPQMISLLLFGGSIKVKERVYNGIIKTGKNKGAVKYKIEEIDKQIEGLGLNALQDWTTKKPGIYQTNEEVLKLIATGNVTHLYEYEKPEIIKDAQAICSILLKIRELNKQIGTYYESTEELIQDNDSCVHANFSQVHLPTGRLGCRIPNTQNQPKPPSKTTEHFVSRYEKGMIIAADYKSLEPRVEAELCQDSNLIRDVNNEIDMHNKHLSLAEHKEYEEVTELVNNNSEWKKKRSRIKPFTFANQYLAGLNTIVRNSGLLKEEVESIIQARQDEYPALYRWHENNDREVQAKGYYKNMLGQMFYFTKYPPKYSWQKNSEYSRNEISNYRTQGTAWTIAAAMIGKFWREKALHNRDKYVMINTIHDNLMLDCKEEYLEQAKEDLKVLEQWKDVCYVDFDYDWTVDIKIDISYGKSWYECF